MCFSNICDYVLLCCVLLYYTAVTKPRSQPEVLFCLRHNSRLVLAVHAMQRTTQHKYAQCAQEESANAETPREHSWSLVLACTADCRLTSCHEEEESHWQMLDKLEETPRQPVANCSSILPTVSCGFPTNSGGAYIVALRRGRLEPTAGVCDCILCHFVYHQRSVWLSYRREGVKDSFLRTRS